MQGAGHGLRISTLMVLMLGVAACTQPDGSFDWDLRSPMAGNTADAARMATVSRPRADERGLISYPGYQVVVARRGETVNTIGARLGVDPVALGRVNAVQPDLPLSGGEALVLPTRVADGGRIIGGGATPGGAVDVGAIAVTALDRVSTPAPVAAAGKEPIRHRVQRGETAYTVARRYNVSARALAEWNGLGADLALREGQTLLIPPADDARPAAAAPGATPPGAGTLTPEPPSAARPLPAEKPVRAGGGAAVAAAPASPTLPVSGGAAKLAMPADGSIIRAYQRKRYDGIGIGATAGSPVRAAADGTVAAITRDTEQVPIIVIRHEGNLLTVYANVDGISVAKDARVKRGQQIGKVRAGSPAFLHFEVRRGSESVDPMTMLQ